MHDNSSTACHHTERTQEKATATITTSVGDHAANVTTVIEVGIEVGTDAQKGLSDITALFKLWRWATVC